MDGFILYSQKAYHMHPNQENLGATKTNSVKMSASGSMALVQLE